MEFRTELAAILILAAAIGWAAVTSANSVLEALVINAAQRDIVSHTVTSGQPSPPECEHLYNVGRSVAWQRCIGVRGE